MISKNKRADIAITILVIGVIVLCTVALVSFYLIRGNQVKGVVNSAYSLQNFYNIADSVKYSGWNKDYQGVSINGNELEAKFPDIGLIIKYEYNSEP